jgi:hypothetical protein
MKKWMIAVMVIATLGFAITPKVADLEPCIKIVGDEVSYTKGVPYLGASRGPGDIVGQTWYDFQSNGSFNQRIDIDVSGQAHMDWMDMNAAGNIRYCGWNFRYDNGSYYGETQASNSWSGYVGLDITRDADPLNERTVVCYHFNPGAGYYGFIDIDGGNGWGTWGSNMHSPEVAGAIWPYIAVANNNNIVMVTGDQNANVHHGFVTTDEGATWTSIFNDDSCATLSHFIRASENTGSNKMVFVNTSFITDSVAIGQLDNDLFYRLSTNNGVTWGSRINITNYQPYPVDSVRAYCNTHAIFDNSDNLHIFWAGRMVTDNYYNASNIFHWDEVSGNTVIVNSPSTYYTSPWWITQVVMGTADTMYCFWHGNDDYNDYSAAGYFNGEIYVSVSFDNGATWTDYENLTNTRSPGAGPGACDDEDYFTVAPKLYNGDVYLTYIEDKDAGGGVMDPPEGVLTDNPVRCWVFPADTLGIEEHNSNVQVRTSLNLYPNPAANGSAVSYTMIKSGSVSLDLFDAAGRLVSNLATGNKVAGTYNVDINTRELANGTYFVILDTEVENVTRSLVIIH